MFTFIDSQKALKSTLAELGSAQNQTLYIDTEFFKRNTFYPKLGLVQCSLCKDEQIYTYLLDAVRLDLSEFWHWACKAALWVMHASSEDIDIIHLQLSRLTTQPNMPNVFDTQIGLSFLGFGLQISYQEALKQCLDTHIDKEESLSDWLARPLTAEQLNYAAEDVVYLPLLYEFVERRLLQQGLYDFVFADCQSFKAEICHTVSDDDIYKTWADFRYTRKQLAQLKRVSAWRERQAKQDDVPRTFLLKKSTLRELIHEQPKKTQALHKLKDMHPKVVRKYGEVILSLLDELPDEQNYPEKVARPFREPKQLGLSATLKKIVKNASATHGVPAEVLMRRRWLTALYEYVAYTDFDANANANANANAKKNNHINHKDTKQLPSYLTGWREAIVTQPLLNVLSNHKELLHEQIVPHEQQNR